MIAVRDGKYHQSFSSRRGSAHLGFMKQVSISSWIFAALASAAAPAAAGAQQSAHAQHHPQQPEGSLLKTPTSIAAEHAELHETLERAAKEPGALGAAARALEAALAPHFRREEEIATPSSARRLKLRERPIMSVSAMGSQLMRGRKSKSSIRRHSGAMSLPIHRRRSNPAHPCRCTLPSCRCCQSPPRSLSRSRSILAPDQPSSGLPAKRYDPPGLAEELGMRSGFLTVGETNILLPGEASRAFNWVRIPSIRLSVIGADDGPLEVRIRAFA
jgi:hypothetical protein